MGGVGLSGADGSGYAHATRGVGTGQTAVDRFAVEGSRYRGGVGFRSHRRWRQYTESFISRETAAGGDAWRRDSMGGSGRSVSYAGRVGWAAPWTFGVDRGTAFPG